MKYLLYLLFFILGFLSIKFDYWITSLIILCFLVLYLIKKRPDKKTLFKYFAIFLVSFSSNFLPYFNSNIQYLKDTTLIVKRAKEKYVLATNFISTYYIKFNDNPYDEGDIIKVSGRLIDFKSNTIESQFDFKEYLKSYCVSKEILPTSIYVRFDYPLSKRSLKNRYINFYNDDAKALISGLNFSTKVYDSAATLGYKNIGLLALLSNSGMFFAFTLNAFKSILSLKLDKKKSSLIATILVTPYVAFNLFSFGILKAYLLSIFTDLYYQKLKGKYEFNYIDRLSIVSLFLLILDPTFILRLEFILSFSLSILFISLSTDFPYKEMENKIKIKHFFIRKIMLFLFFIPVQLNMNYSINFLSIILQIFFIPLFKIFYFISFISFFLGYNPILDYFAIALNKPIEFFSDISLNIHANAFPVWLINLYYLIYFIYVLIYENKWLFIEKKLRFAAIFFFLMYFIPIENGFTTQVIFINCGQGDNILIRDKYTTCMIDTGGLRFMDIATSSTIPFLKKHKIYNLDTVFITHDDFDHCGGLESLKANFHVKKVIRERDAFPYKIGNLYFENLNHLITDNKNESSMVLYSKIKGVNFLFLGDASKRNEREILKEYPDLKIDILKAGHHGSNTSTDEDFIAHYLPKDAIISCGKNNKYGHPHEETLDILNKYHINIRRTDVEGSIVYNL